MRNIFTLLLKGIILWVFNAACFLVSSWLLPGLTILSRQELSVIISAMSVSLIFTLLNLLVRPFLLLLTIPLTGLTSGLFSLLINAFTISLVAYFTDMFVIDSIWTGFVASFLFALTNIIFSSLIPIDDDLLYFDFVGERIKKQTRVQDDGKKGLIVLEIDGLSYSRMQKAVSKKLMPFVSELLDSGNYQIDEFDCGIPSQTSSSQAGIMFGRNQNICAFRWYDKSLKKVISSGNFQDANWIEKRILEEKPGGLLQGGVSINNLMSGNAAAAILTVSSILPRSNEELITRNIDMYLFSVNPYLLTKSILHSLFEAVVEIMQYVWAKVSNKRPRLNRLRRFYPLVRGAASVLLRDISTALIINDVYRGRPAIYATFYGHDEIAHHSGPDSLEAMHALNGIDRSIKKIWHAAEKDAGREYELLILSDHGQSFGTTFKQRYGYPLSTFIRQLAYECAVEKAVTLVTGIENSADNDASIRAALIALRSFPAKNPKSIREQALSRIEKALDKNERRELIEELESQESDIWVLASGNLVNVYFSFLDHKIDLSAIDAHYPNLVQRLIEHPGVGLIVVQKDGVPTAIGKEGSRNLATGAISGKDPFLPYGNAELRLEQLSYLSQFPSGGDIILFSTVYADGTIASFEELIGSHGGMGGEQTSAFIFHPTSVSIPDHISNSTQMYEILLNRRNQLSESTSRTRNPAEVAESASDWRISNLLAGIRQTSRWTPLLRDMVLFQGDAYRKIGNDPVFNGPALLISLISLASNLLVWLLMTDIPFQKGIAAGFLSWTGGLFILVSSAYFSALILEQEELFGKLVRGFLFCSIFDILWFGALIPGFMEFWFVPIFIIRLVAASTAAAGIANLQGKKRLLVVPVIFGLFVLTSLIFFVLLESIATIFQMDWLRQMNTLLRIYLKRP